MAAADASGVVPVHLEPGIWLDDSRVQNNNVFARLRFSRFVAQTQQPSRRSSHERT